MRKRKNDTGRCGIMTRIPGGTLQHMMRPYALEQQLVVGPRCTKPGKPGAACPYCPPFFPKLVLRAGRAPPVQANGRDARVAVTRQNVTTGVKSVIGMLGVDASHPAPAPRQSPGSDKAGEQERRGRVRT